jgi:diguanylate cyclase (GGDEF)-like protein
VSREALLGRTIGRVVQWHVRQEGSVPTQRQPQRSASELFAAAAAAVARSDDLDDALALLLGLGCEHLDAASGAVFILDADRDELSLTVTSGIAAEIDADASVVKDVSNSHDPLAEIVRLRHPAPVDDAGHVLALRGMQTAYLLPLVVRRDGIEISLGAMALGFSGPLPAARTLASAEPLADLAAVTVERALTLSMGSERAEWFDRLAHIDLLTGLANRRTVDSIMELEVARAGRQGAALSVALFGIDRFGEIEAAGGNAAVDEALRRVAQVLTESVRLVDTIGRYGADEFLLLAPGPDGLVVTERLVRGVARLAPVDGRKLSLSAGIASFPMDGRTPEELLEVARRSMRQAQSRGGGRVVAETPAAD